jgi:hypothetical protein
MTAIIHSEHIRAVMNSRLIRFFTRNVLVGPC